MKLDEQTWRRNKAIFMIKFKQKQIENLEFVSDQWAKDAIKNLQAEINEFYKDFPELREGK